MITVEAGFSKGVERQARIVNGREYYLRVRCRQQLIAKHARATSSMMLGNVAALELRLVFLACITLASAQALGGIG
jgi:hypothetical protein